MAQPVESPEVPVNAASKDTWSASTYNNTASFVYSPAFTSAVLSLLDAKPGEKIIDIGCGSGEVTREIHRLVGAAGLVVGMDSSESMVRQCAKCQSCLMSAGIAIVAAGWRQLGCMMSDYGALQSDCYSHFVHGIAS